MKSGKGIVIGLLVLLVLAGTGRQALAFLGFGGDSWKEEVLLHDGSKLIVQRTVERGGRHEIGQMPPYKEQSLVFAMPGTSQQVTWEDKFSKDLGTANFLPMLLDLDVRNGVAYLVVSPMGCLSYNKWERPNPPYVVFRYDGKAWQRIPLAELPDEITRPNLIFSAPDLAVEKSGSRFMTAEMIQAIISDNKQPEYQIILREPLDQKGMDCGEMIYYKGAWIGPGDSIGKRMMEHKYK